MFSASEVLEHISDGFVTLDSEWRFTYVNRRAGEVLGRAPSDLLGKTFWTEFSEAVGSAFHRACERAMRTQEAVQVEDFYAPLECWFENRLHPSPEGVSILFADITARKQAEAALHRRDAVLEAVGLVSERFLRGGNWRAQIAEVLARLGEAAGASRVYVMECHAGSGGARLSQRFEWTAAGVEPQIDNPELQSFCLDELGLGRWKSAFARGEPIEGHVATFPAEERASLEAQGIRSIVAVPVFTDGQWWGLLGFDECRTEREWTRTEREALRMAAGALGAAIEREQMEASLAEREERLRQIAESSRDVFWICNRDASEFLYVSPAYEAVWGRSLESLYADAASFAETIHPEDREQILSLLRECLEGRTVEYRIVHPDGSVRWVSSRGEPVRDGAGRVIRIAGVTQDITERRRTEQARAAAEEHYRRLVGTSPYAVYVLDGAGRFTEVNPAGEELLGRSAESVLGDPFGEVVHPGDHGRAADVFSRVLSGRENDVETELRILRPSGELRSVAITTTAVQHEGRIVGVHGIARDITEHRSLEEQLRQAQKMEAVGRLAGGVAHDFNNQLTAILGFSKLLELELPAELELGEYLGEIQKAAERSAKLTHQLLAFSRRQVLQPQVVNLNEAVQNTDRLLRRLIGRDVELVTLPGAEAGWVTADPTQLEQVLVNLVVNARDALPRGGRIVVQTRLRKVEEPLVRRPAVVPPGDYALLSVRDDGSGMDAATLERIFEPFFTTKPPGKGTGLGLSMVLGVVQQSGGYVSVRSEPGRGTIFDVFLPRAERSEGEAPSPPRAPADAGGGTVLLVEDERAVRAIARAALNGAGYQVLEAENGEEALRVWGEHRERIDLLVTDLTMPLMGGRELVRRLAEGTASIPVIYMSGYTEDLGTGEEPARGSRFLAKPFAPEELVCAVRALCGRPEPAPA